jgi:hypothetical protein
MKKTSSLLSRMASRNSVTNWNFFCDMIKYVPPRINRLLRQKKIIFTITISTPGLYCRILLPKWCFCTRCGRYVVDQSVVYRSQVPKNIRFIHLLVPTITRRHKQTEQVLCLRYHHRTYL